MYSERNFIIMLLLSSAIRSFLILINVMSNRRNLAFYYSCLSYFHAALGLNPGPITLFNTCFCFFKSTMARKNRAGWPWFGNQMRIIYYQRLVFLFWALEFKRNVEMRKQAENWVKCVFMSVYLGK